jgi:glycine/D-amino acid oxidase-like deaminating enzyme/nitrite reductase/ring-hydroxylating ferredoxin subunit
MRGNSGYTWSPWLVSAHTPARPPLHADARADVCVVGGGIAGLSVAYHLALEGRRVMVLDAGPIGGGQSGRTTAHLSNAMDDLYVEIARIHGQDGARLAADSHTAAIERIEAIVDAESIDCDLQRLDGYLFTPPGEAPEILHDELRAAHGAGLTNVELVPRAPLDGFDTGPALRFPRQAQFHVLKYLSGLVRAIERRGGRIHCGTRVEAVTGGRPARLRTRGGVVVCDAVVVATDTPFVSRVPVHARQHVYATYVIGAALPPTAAARALYWDTADPHHYARMHTLPEGDVVIVGGEDHKVGEADDAAQRWAALDSWARERFAGMGDVIYRWSGEVLAPVDGIGLIGRNPDDHDNVFIATDDSGMGMTHGTIAGILLNDLIHRRHNPWAALYDPARVRLRAVRPFVAEAVNMAAQYGRWLSGSDVESADAIPRGAGAVVRRHLSKVAVYRDDAGVVHERSAVCPHLGCAVAWNQAERTWDCPCHGSRFDAYGRLLNGPAAADLAPAEPREPRRRAS